MPASGPQSRKAGTLQGVLLLLPVIMAVMGVVVLTPVLPRMQAHFKSVPGAQYLVQIALTAPALSIGLLSPIAGAVVDAVGRRRVLLSALVLYAVVGILPIFLGSLTAIILSRLILGATEAAIMTASTTLIGDYFHGSSRDKWLGYQTALATASSVVLFPIGGALGSISWRAPFALYSASLIFMAALVLWTWEPVCTEPSAAKGEARARGERIPWGTLLPMCALGVFGGIMFYTVQIQLSLILSSNYSITSPSRIGLLTALGSIGIPVGAILYRYVAGFPLSALLLSSFLLLGVSFVSMNHAYTYQVAETWVIVNQLGCGLLLPTMVVSVMAKLPFSIRGRGTGLFTGAWFIGQFLSPPAVTSLGTQVHGLLGAIQLFGVLCLIAAGAALLTLVRRSSRLRTADLKVQSHRPAVSDQGAGE
jgi:MFS family permease